MSLQDSSPAVLLHHDGELGDVRKLLESLGASFTERLGAPTTPDDVGRWDVIIASPRRLLHVRPGASNRPTLIAILEGDSRTLRSHLRRLRVDLMVKRPVHPAALRLLILHALYRGPERRHRQRVSVGAEIRIRTGLFSRTATLADLSLRGCRILASGAISRGRSIRLLLPTNVTGSRKLRIKGTVVRSGPASRSQTDSQIVAVRFEPVSDRLGSQLRTIIDRHLTGPAVMPNRGPESETETAPAGQTPTSSPSIASEAALAPVSEESEAAVHEVETEPPSEGAVGDRRGDERRTYGRKVVALGEQAARVLLGRDISRGGMRVDANDSLSVGDVLQIALHTTDRAEPLVVRARVKRDDGSLGLVLCFETADDAMGERLNQLIDHLPLVEGSGEEDEGVVISEILEQRAS